jgi:hypothetical protein
MKHKLGPPTVTIYISMVYLDLQEGSTRARPKKIPGRWDSVMSKIAENQRKHPAPFKAAEVKSRVFDGLAFSPSQTHPSTRGKRQQRYE